MSSDSESSSTTRNENLQFSLDDTEAPVIAGNRGWTTVRLRETDAGAVKEGGKTARDALDLAGEVTGQAIESGEATSRRAIDLSKFVVRETGQQQQEATETAVSAVQNASQRFNQRLAQFARQVSKTSDQQVAQLSKFAIGASVAFVALASLSGGSGK